MKINNFKINEKSKPYIIAELSGNHNGDINNFLKIIDYIKFSGANAVKLQTFKPEELTLNSNKKPFLVKHKFKKWNNKTLFELYKDAYTPWEWHDKILKKSKKLGLDFISTPFHNSAVDFLNKIGVDCFKIASFEFNDHNLVEYTAKKKKPMILSTGMAYEDEILTNFKILNKNSKNNFAFLKCSSSYPAPILDLNLKTIKYLKKKYKCEVGFSDHTYGNLASTVAISFGASIIEKHICLDKKIGVDSDFSLDPDEFKQFVKDCHLSWQSKGKIYFGPTKSELASIKNRRSLFVIEDIKKGEKFSLDNIGSRRPAMGLKPIYLKKFLGKKAKTDLKKTAP